MIECAFQGRSGAAAVMAESRSGRTYAKFSIAVRGKGEDQPEWVQCVAFDDVARGIADLSKGEKVYVEGELRLNRWAPENGDERANLACVARKAVVLERIGRKRRGLKRVSVDGRDPRLEDAREHRERQLEDMNDPIPFSRGPLMNADDRKAHLCVRCRERPRLGALTRCKACLRADAAAQVGDRTKTSKRLAIDGELKS